MILVISVNTTDRQRVRKLLLDQLGYTESWLNEMAAGEFLYFKIDERYERFTTIKHDDFDDEFKYQMNRNTLVVYSSSEFIKRYTP